MLARKTIFFLFSFLCCSILNAQSLDSTYAEKLGYPKGARVLILHVDDVGMSFDSNEGAINAMTEGIANSCSVMMPCSWVPAFIHYYKKHPKLDVGLHLTLTSEWSGYRWGPLVGKTVAPGLVDKEGAMWSSVENVVKHASADEVEKEIRAQIDRARTMGIEPTHLDSHMGTLFGSPEFLMRYIQVGIENHIPVMLPAGHASLIKVTNHMPEAQINQIRQLGKMLWDAKLPVLDDLHNESYDWEIPKELQGDNVEMQEYKTKKYIEAVHSLKPGLTMMIMHCTSPSEVFPFISGSGPLRKGDMLAMMDPELKSAINREEIILTTWRELLERRLKLNN
jgi:hypothetical protein